MWASKNSFPYIINSSRWISHKVPCRSDTLHWCLSGHVRASRIFSCSGHRFDKRSWVEATGCQRWIGIDWISRVSLAMAQILSQILMRNRTSLVSSYVEHENAQDMIPDNRPPEPVSDIVPTRDATPGTRFSSRTTGKPRGHQISLPVRPTDHTSPVEVSRPRANETTVQPVQPQLSSQDKEDMARAEDLKRLVRQASVLLSLYSSADKWSISLKNLPRRFPGKHPIACKTRF
jgi:hypothetical protein